METQTANARVVRIPKVWTLGAKLWVPHQGRELAFASPAFGPDNYRSVGRQILHAAEKNLSVPIGEYSASLLHAAYCNTSVSGEPEFEDVQQKMKSDWLWVYNRNIFTEKGVFVLPDLQAQGIREEDVNELESALTDEREGLMFSNDGNIRFAPKDTYRFGEHTPESLAEDGFIRISYGFEGAKKLGEASAKFRKNPRTYGFDVKEGDVPTQRLSALNEYDDRFHVIGINFGDNGRCHAFGVL